MAISRNMMERQLGAGGGIMTLEEPRQGYFLGKIVRKAKKAVKKVVKSPLGKTALLGALGAYGLGALGGKSFALKNAFNLANMKAGLGTIGSAFGSKGKLSTLGDLFRVGGKAGADFSVPRILGGVLAGTAIGAPFFMGGDEEEVDEGTPFTSPQASIENIRDQAKAYYSDPTKSALYFMPPKAAVQSSFYADGGLASMRPGYRFGNMVQKAGQMIKSGMGKVKSLFDDADINISVRDEDVLTDAGLQAQATGLDVTITPKSGKAAKVIDGLIEEGYDIAKAEDGTYAISSLDEGALDLIAQRLRLGGEDIQNFMKNYDDMYSGSDEKMIMDALRQRKAEGGLMDLGGFEKDYREGGFVPLGAEERADDVPARLSKNEFVFTADAVRAAGEGDIDKGAEVMQNMMDNLEAGGTISEESQGLENPAQAMFDQAQQLESRIE